MKQGMMAIGMLMLFVTVSNGQLVDNSELKYIRFDVEMLSTQEMELYIQVQDGKIRQLKDQLMVVEKTLEKNRQQLDSLTQQADRLRRDLNQLGSASAFKEVGIDLAKRQTLLSIELVGAKARQKALIDAREKSSGGQKEVLRKKLDLVKQVHKQNLDQYEQLKKLSEKGLVSESQIAKSRMAITNSEIDILEQEQALVLALGDSSSASEQLLAASVDIAQITAQLALIEEKVEMWNKLQPLQARIRTIEANQQPVLMDQIQSLTLSKSELEQQVLLESLKRDRKAAELESSKKKKEKELKESKKKQESEKSEADAASDDDK